MKKLFLTIWLLTLLILQLTMPLTAFAGPGDSVPGEEDLALDEGETFNSALDSESYGVDDEGSISGPSEHNDADAERLRRESLTGSQMFNEDCYGYPNGDSTDSSDFALKIDCILDTDEQDQSYFNWGWRTAPIEKVIIKAINYLMATIGSVAMLLIVIAGLMMITSPADENQRSKAIEILQSSIVSLVVAFSAYIIVNAVEGLFY
ncbi:MAG: pilin [Candidatus Peregrinibacteria bacterium]|nr:pilin [Candidatus Peregrinibacteria bacterium]MDZ4244538.1 pilin [Candidatus Gracilibacteria bacterium]